MKGDVVAQKKTTICSSVAVAYAAAPPPPLTRKCSSLTPCEHPGATHLL